MRSRIRYTDEPMENFKVVKDFLPPPEDLVLKEDNVKVTIALSRTSVDFFKRMARNRHTSYQKMIRRLVDAYSARYQEHP
jgi:predicted DNA binding CopG/RHH family protein